MYKEKVKDMHRTCIGGGWTSSERSLINSHLSRVLPIIEDIYGQAFMTDKWWRRGNPFVKIIKEDFPGDRVGLTCAPWYAAVCFAITGEFPCTLWPWDDNGYIVINPDTFSSEADEALLTHELFHAFRLNWILTYPQFEEGHAEAGTIIATKELCRSYGRGCGYIINHYIYSPYYIEVFYNDETYDCLHLSSEKPKYIKRGRSLTFYTPKPIEVSIYDVFWKKKV